MSQGTLPAELKAATDEALRDLHQRIPGVIGCVVATVDGRLVSHIADNEADPRRIAAMIGTIVALGETIGREVNIGQSQYVAVHSLGGMLLMLRVPARKDVLVVGTLARPTTNLGIVLYETRQSAQIVGAALDRWIASVRSANESST